MLETLRNLLRVLLRVFIKNFNTLSVKFTESLVFFSPTTDKTLIILSIPPLFLLIVFLFYEFLLTMFSIEIMIKVNLLLNLIIYKHIY